MAGMADDEYSGRLIPLHLFVTAVGNEMNFKGCRWMIFMAELAGVFDGNF